MTITSMNVVNVAEQCQVSVVVDSLAGTPNVIVVIDGRAYTAALTPPFAPPFTPAIEIPPITSHQIYCMGDSLTAGNHYETQLLTHLDETWDTHNLGISGQNVSQMLARFGDVTGPGDAEYVIIFGGVNSVAGGVSAVNIEASLQAMYDAAFAAGIKVVAVTITPFKGDAPWWTSDGQVVLEAVNVWILNTATHVDYRINAYAVFEDPSVPDTLLPAYDDGGHIHMTIAGYNALGDTIYAGATWTP